MALKLGRSELYNAYPSTSVLREDGTYQARVLAILNHAVCIDSGLDPEKTLKRTNQMTLEEACAMAEVHSRAAAACTLVGLAPT